MRKKKTVEGREGFSGKLRNLGIKRMKSEGNTKIKEERSRSEVVVNEDDNIKCNKWKVLVGKRRI